MVSKEVVQLKLEQLKDNEQQEVVNFINYLLWRQQQKRTVSQRYDFTDLAGKLIWQGDAVAAQREIRDEW